MKHASEIRKSVVLGGVLSIALGLTGTSLTAQGMARPRLNGGEGSLENDVRRGPAEVERPTLFRQRSATLDLSVSLGGNDDIVPSAILPLPEDLSTHILLSGGTPGELALIEIGPVRVSPQGGIELFHVAAFHGTFGYAGEFEVVLPAGTDLRHFGVRGAQYPTRTATVVVNLDDAIEQAFAADWQVLGTLPRPPAAGRPGGSAPASHGHAAAGKSPGSGGSREVDLDGDMIDTGLEVSWQELGNVAPPRRAGTPGRNGLASRPARRASGAQIDSRMRSRFVDLDGPNLEGFEPAWDVLGAVPKPKSVGQPGDTVSGDQKALRAGAAQIDDRMRTASADQDVAGGANGIQVYWEKMDSVTRPRRAGTPHQGYSSSTGRHVRER